MHACMHACRYVYCMHVCMYMRIYAYMYIKMYMHACVCTHVQIYMHAYAHARTHAFMRVCVHVRVHIHSCMYYAHIFICIMYPHLFIYTYFRVNIDVYIYARLFASFALHRILHYAAQILCARMYSTCVCAFVVHRCKQEHTRTHWLASGAQYCKAVKSTVRILEKVQTVRNAQAGYPARCVRLTRFHARFDIPRAVYRARLASCV